ncbi:MAG: hypothetical protein H6720_08560 [Sandaracinus sp.]|nr:hypothetical protein [Myxococcales bacterium]MCB9600392.1 hypothetical protein [Sandaracinus sp.]
MARDLRDSVPPKKRVAKARLQAAPDELDGESTGRFSAPGEWASLLGDLSPGDRAPEWRVHDRTHLELAVDYPVGSDGDADHIWEAYFFVPKSLRLNSESYSKDDIYRDFQSWIRFALHRRMLGELATNAVPKLAEALAKDEATAVHELRVFASEVRTALLAARRRIEEVHRSGEHDTVEALTRTLLVRVRELLDATRLVLPNAATDGAKIAARWIDEDLSLVAETLLASLSLDLRSKHDELAGLVAAGAVHEARYRRDHGLEGVGHAKVSKREIEHLEFRRHVLKRFTASALQAETLVSEAGRFTLQVLYAVAASIAMSFAVVAAAYHGTHANASAFQSPWMWAAVVILAYAGKDRIKATLQNVFAGWVAKHLPDRLWKLRVIGQPRFLGTIKERSAFVGKSDIPRPVIGTRNSTRQHALEEHARPEEVLWHQKVCRVDSRAMESSDTRFAALTEVFRLDLRRWLAHTDDPKQRIVFADPDDAHVYAANAPRVYNIAIVYRLRRANEENAPWKRIRVIVSRKGIQRIEHVC